MDTDKKIPIKDLIMDLRLDIVYMPKDSSIYVESTELNRPGLQLAGYFEFFSNDRIQIVGKTEYNYFAKVDSKKREEILDKYFSYDIPALIITSGLDASSDFIKYAKKYNKILLSTKKNTSKITSKLLSYLESKLSPTTTIHGVLVDVYGIGVLIKGDSNIGKSETALELVQRGNRLVADDSVEIRRHDDNKVVGKSPEILKYLLEIRGIGIIDVRSLYGVGAIKNSKSIDMVVYLEAWDSTKYYDRLGLDKDYEKILGVNLEKLIIPVRPGRNTSMIIEVAAMNFRQKGMGYDAAEEFNNKLLNMIDKKSNNSEEF